jgi:hypothetical protein
VKKVYDLALIFKQPVVLRYGAVAVHGGVEIGRRIGDFVKKDG